ncbi:MAG: AhpD family alkylhydroperoxidase [Rhodothermales bacterium]|jgi:AhpD family alkylhydroperoxidase
MATVPLIEYDDASPEVRQMYDELREARQTEYINNFWKALANQPTTLKRLWSSLNEVMAPGELDAVTKQMIYIAVSVANGCEYCIHSHTAAATGLGMTPGQYEELLAVIGIAHETNGLASAMQVPVDDNYLK